MADTEMKMSWEGIQLVWLVCSLFGAALGLGAMPPMSKRACWVALGSGLFCGVFTPGLLPELISWWRDTPVVPFPVVVNNALAFIFGVAGIFFVPGVIAFTQEFGTNPWNWMVRVAKFVAQLRVPDDTKKEGK